MVNPATRPEMAQPPHAPPPARYTGSDASLLSRSPVLRPPPPCIPHSAPPTPHLEASHGEPRTQSHPPSVSRPEPTHLVSHAHSPIPRDSLLASPPRYPILCPALILRHCTCRAPVRAAPCALPHAPRDSVPHAGDRDRGAPPVTPRQPQRPPRGREDPPSTPAWLNASQRRRRSSWPSHPGRRANTPAKTSGGRSTKGEWYAVSPIGSASIPSW